MNTHTVREEKRLTQHNLFSFNIRNWPCVTFSLLFTLKPDKVSFSILLQGSMLMIPMSTD